MNSAKLFENLVVSTINTKGRIAVILPAFNESASIESSIYDFLPYKDEIFLIVIDNASSDGTGKIAKCALTKYDFEGQVLSEPRKGKGNAICAALRRINAEIYVMLDADTTYKASDLPAMLEPVLNGSADLVVGNRHAGGQYKRENNRLFHNFGNNLIKHLINRLFGAKVQDIMSGYRVMNRKFVEFFPIYSTGFQIETEMTIHALYRRFKVVEIPIIYANRMLGSHSKLNTVSDGLRVLRTILSVFKTYKPLTFFGSLALASFVGGIASLLSVCLNSVPVQITRFASADIAASFFMIIALILFAIGAILHTVTRLDFLSFQMKLCQFERRSKY